MFRCAGARSREGPVKKGEGKKKGEGRERRVCPSDGGCFALPAPGTRRAWAHTSAPAPHEPDQEMTIVKAGGGTGNAGAGRGGAGGGGRLRGRSGRPNNARRWGGGGPDGGASACPHRPSISALHPPHRRRHRPAHRRWVAWGGGGGGGAAETGSAFWLEKKTRASAPPSPGSHCPRPSRPRARPPRRAHGRTVRGNKFQPGRVGVGNVEGQRTFFLSFLWDGGRRIEQVGGSARARASPTRKKKRRRSLSLPPGRGPSHTEKTMASPARPTPAAP